MNRITFSGFGTLYGTVNDYNSDGTPTGTAKNLTGYGIFFIVRKDFTHLSQIVFKKSIGDGIAITNASAGQFSVSVNYSNVNVAPNEYAYECFLCAEGTAWSGTAQLKGIGSGIFEITKGARYGTV